MMSNQTTINVSLGQMTLSSVPKVLERGSRDACQSNTDWSNSSADVASNDNWSWNTAMLKKAGASSKARKRIQ